MENPAPGWRKRRLQKFIEVQVAKNQLDPTSQGF
jgi:hypothetical protein